MNLKEMEDLIINAFRNRRIDVLPYNKLIIEPGIDQNEELFHEAIDSLIQKGILRKDGIIYHLVEI